MIDSLEKQALSCTFVVRKGEIQSLDDSDGGPAALTALAVGTIIDGKYQIISQIGEGGMGAVYKVRHLLLNKEMALKTFRSRAISDLAWQRFQREAQAIAKLKHKNIVEVYDFGQAENDLPFYTMELLEGESLSQRLADVTSLKPINAMRIFLQAAEALAHAHRHKIVHRDIKPGNIFLQDTGDKKGISLVKIVDFGIAKLAEDSAAGEDQFLTREGTIFGTPLYMSPEQSMGGEVDQRSDIYSFGCAFFQALVGYPPLAGDSAIATLLNHQTTPAPRLKDVLQGAPLSQRTDNLIAKLLEKNPARRYQTFDDVARDIAFCIEDIEKRKTGPARSDLPAGSSAGADADREPVAQEQSKVRIIIGALVCLVLMCAAGGFIYMRQPGPAKSMKASGPHDYDRTMCPISVASDDKIGDKVFEDVYKSERQAEMKGHHTFMIHDGPDGQEFQFFKYGSIGSLEILDGEAKPCQRKVRVFPRRKLIFRANEQVFYAPVLLSFFGSNTLYGLQLAQPALDHWSAKRLSNIQFLRGLQDLNIANCVDMNDEIIDIIGRLKYLYDLDVSKCGADGRMLARLKNLPQIQTLIVNCNKDLPPLFERMAQEASRCQLNTLQAGNSGVSDKDLLYLGKIKSLTHLYLDESTFETDSFKHLKNLPNLSVLNLEQSKLSREATESLADLGKLPQINQIAVTRGFVDPVDLARLHQRLGRKLTVCDPKEKANE